MSSFSIEDNYDLTDEHVVMVDTKLPFTKEAIAEYIKELDNVFAQDLFDTIDKLRTALDTLQDILKDIKAVCKLERGIDEW